MNKKRRLYQNLIVKSIPALFKTKIVPIFVLFLIMAFFTFPAQATISSFPHLEEFATVVDEQRPPPPVGWVGTLNAKGETTTGTSNHPGSANGSIQITAGTGGGNTLITEQVNYTGKENADISYWIRGTGSSAGAAYLYYQIDGGSWVLIQTIPAWPTDSGWHQYSVSNITALDGQSNVKFKWLLDRTAGSWSLDDVNFTADDAPVNNPPNIPGWPNFPWWESPYKTKWFNDNTILFEWKFTDPDGGDTQGAFQVQVDDDSNFGSVNYDSTKISSSNEYWTSPAISNGGYYYWRAKTWDNHNKDGSWINQAWFWDTSKFKVDATAPGSWANFASQKTDTTWVGTASWNDDQTPDCRVQVTDATSGLKKAKWGYGDDANTVGHWALEPEEPNEPFHYDESGNQNHGTGSNVTWGEDCGFDAYQGFGNEAGSCQQFNGTSSDITIPATSDINLMTVTDRTVEVWFKADDTTGRQVIYEEGGSTNGLAIYMNGDQLYVGCWTGGAGLRYLNTTVTSGAWHYAALVLDSSSTLYGYLDGAQFDSGSVSSSVGSHSGNISFGRSGDGIRWEDNSTSDVAGEYFDGMIDEVRISNTARSAEDIALYYNNAAQYSYSTNEGGAWSAWAAAALAGSDGDTVATYITASSVPFNQDHATNNQIKFRVMDIAGNIGTSGAYTVKIDATPPNQVTGLSAVSAGKNRIRLTWTAIAEDPASGFSKYTVYYATSPGVTRSSSSWTTIDDANLGTRTTTSTIVTGLTADQAHYFKIGAEDNVGNLNTLSSEANAQTLWGTRDVVINEIAWMGTLAATSHEWIEIYNNRAFSIYLTGWKFNDGNDCTLSGTLGSGSYYLIEDTESSTSVASDQTWGTMSLLNTGELLTLKDPDVILIDSANRAGGWYAGLNTGNKPSMERKNPSIAGTDSGNWAHNDGVTKNGQTAPYGEPPTPADIYGTPKSVNSCYDETAPTVSNVTSSTANGSYKAGVVIAVTVTFNENVYVAATPQIELETGATDRKANYASGSGGTTLTFNYTVISTDTSGDLDYTGTGALTLNGGTIKDTALNDANRTLAAPAAEHSLGYNKAIIIDTTDPNQPSTPNLAAADDTGSSDSDDITKNTTGLTFSGTAEANSTVELFAGVASKGTTPADGAGNWSKDISLTAGTYDITAKATDAAGNTSIDSIALPVIVDNTIPTIEITSVTSSQGTTNWYEQAATVTYWYSDNDSIAHTVTISGTLNDTGGAGVWKTEYSTCFGETGTPDTGATFSSNEYIIAADGTDPQGSIIVTGHDNAGNTHTDTVTFNEDNAVPTIVSGSWGDPDASDYLYPSSSNLYFSDLMGVSSVTARLSGTASDGGAGLWKMTFSSETSLNGSPGEDDTTPAEWSGDYTVVEASTAANSPATVTLYDNVSNTATADYNYYEDTTAPDNVGCSTPVDDAKGQSIDPTLTALTATDAGADLSLPYYFILATDTDFNQNVQNSEWQASTSWTPSTTLSVNTTYYWMVQAKDNVENKSAQCGHTADTEGYGTFTTAAVDHPVISEIQVAGGIADDEFVEIYNPTGYTINLGSFKGTFIRLRRRVAGGPEYAIKSWSGETANVPAYGYWLWAKNEYDGTITADTSTAGGGIADNGSLALTKGFATDYWDQVAYGSGHTTPFIEGTAYGTNPPDNQSIERKPGCPLGNATDNNENSTDFEAQTSPNPQNSNCPTVTSITPTSGGASTVITITGKKFVSLPVVELWSSSAKVADCDDESFTSATQISAKIPTSGLTNNTTYYVVVKNPDGQQNYLVPGGFTFSGTSETKITITNWRELY